MPLEKRSDFVSDVLQLGIHRGLMTCEFLRRGVASLDILKIKALNQ